MEFGEALRAQRTRRGWTQVELAEQAKVSTRTVTGLESGRGRPRPGTARLLADALDLDRADRDEFLRFARDEADALPGDEAPPPTTPRQVRRQLPHDIAQFTGRQDELAALDLLLAGVDQPDETAPTIVTIDGAPGIGKTTLAVHWAHRAARHFPDVQLYLNLRGYGPGEPVPPAAAAETLLRALGVRSEAIPSSVDERAALLRTTFADFRVLLLLDNARDAGQVRPLLPGTTGLVVVTSRNQLRGLSVHDGAHRVTLHRLSRHQSVELLAAAVGPARVAAERVAAERLAELCDQVPLALAIVAERAHRTGSLAEVVAALEDERARLDNLDTGENDPHGDLRAAMSWSYGALGADAAAMFRKLGLHPASDVGVTTAAALADVPMARARVSLDQLVAAHLVEQRRPHRYELHDLIRLYAAEMARTQESPDELEQTVRRVLDWYLHAAVRADRELTPHRRHDFVAPYEPQVPPPEFGGVAGGRSWFEEEYDSLRAVVSWAAANGWAGHAWRIALAMATFFDCTIPWRDGMEFYEAACAAARSAGEPDGEGYTLNTLGCVYVDGTDWPAAKCCFEQSLECFHGSGNRVGEGMVLGNLGLVLGNLGLVRGELADVELARRYATTALELFERLGNARGVAQNLDNLGAMLTVAGEYRQAVEHHLQAHALNQKSGDDAAEAQNQHNLARAYAGLGERAKAIRAYRTAITLHRAAGNRRWEALVRTDLGKVLDEAGHPDLARNIWESALTMMYEFAEPTAKEIQAVLSVRRGSDVAAGSGTNGPLKQGPRNVR